MALNFTTPKTQQPVEPSAPQEGLPNFMKTGHAAKSAMEQDEARAAALAGTGLWRFYMKNGETREVTFLDGHVVEETGLLSCPMYHEHTVALAGRWHNIVCLQPDDICPVCEAGDSPALVGVFTVIDHTPHTIQKGANAGKVIQNQRKLFVAKRKTLKMLTTVCAEVTGGILEGTTFMVQRTGDREPNVGSVFIPKSQRSKDELQLEYEDVSPANYAEEIKRLSPEELGALGYHVPTVGNLSAGEAPANLADKL